MIFNIRKQNILITITMMVILFAFAQGPEKVSAQAFNPNVGLPGVFVPVNDSANLVQNTTTAVNSTVIQEKETVLDGLATQAAKIVISNITDSIVTWINSGFEGSPAFVTNPESFFVDVGDQIAGNFIAGTELGFLCEPFQLEIRQALSLDVSSTFATTNYCRLSDTINNTENFLKFTQGDFSQGGWDSWFQISQNPSSNPLGAYTEAKAELAIRTARGKEVELAKLNWGQGFLSWRDCVQRDPETEECIEYSDIKTPGSVIESQLNETLGTGIRQLELADEINEIVGALVGQLAQTVLTEGLSSFGAGGQNYSTIRNSARDLYVSCYPNRRAATVGETVKWTAFVYGGTPTGTITYTWSGSPSIVGTTENAYSVYTTPGSKTASVRVTKSAQNKFANCSATVEVSP